MENLGVFPYSYVGFFVADEWASNNRNENNFLDQKLLGLHWIPVPIIKIILCTDFVVTVHGSSESTFGTDVLLHETYSLCRKQADNVHIIAHTIEIILAKNIF